MWGISKDKFFIVHSDSINSHINEKASSPRGVAGRVRISEVVEHSGVPARLLRYYEEQGLLNPLRNPSGYRDYTDQDIELVRRIRHLLDAGLSTATIRTVLPCLTDQAGRLAPICKKSSPPASPCPDDEPAARSLAKSRSPQGPVRGIPLLKRRRITLDFCDGS
jgi:DNA-binding transcriptional MerR regulator